MSVEDSAAHMSRLAFFADAVVSAPTSARKLAETFFALDDDSHPSDELKTAITNLAEAIAERIAGLDDPVCIRDGLYKALDDLWKSECEESHSAANALRWALSHHDFSHVSVAPAKEEWGWMYDDVYAEEVHGIFESREAALADVQAYEAEIRAAGHTRPIKVIINQITRPLVRNYLPDLDQLLEYMDDQAIDEDFSHYDDCIFEVSPDKQEQAAVELQSILLTWADKWIDVANTWTLDETGGERVTIEGDGKE